MGTLTRNGLKVINKGSSIRWIVLRTFITSILSRGIHPCRGIFKTLSKNSNGTFCQYREELIAINSYRKKGSVTDVWQGPEYTSEAYMLFTKPP